MKDSNKNDSFINNIAMSLRTSKCDKNMKKDSSFKDFRKQLPDEIRQMIDSLGISSFEDLLALLAAMGMDMDKLEKSIEDGSLEAGNVQFEDLLVDDIADVSNPFSLGDDEGLFADDETDKCLEKDPFRLPRQCFLGDKPQELHLRIKLVDAPVSVWREVKVPSNISLELFAYVINDAMGWENEHLHEFEVDGVKYKHTACIKMDNDMGLGYGKTRVLDTNKYPISQFFKEKKARMKYEYDFGDGWLHEVWLKGLREYEPDETPSFIIYKGSGACPPEDCGGIWGYSELLEIKAKKRKTAEEKDRLDWYGINRSFDPEYFDVEETQDVLDDLWEIAIERSGC